MTVVLVGKETVPKRVELFAQIYLLQINLFSKASFSISSRYLTPQIREEIQICL